MINTKTNSDDHETSQSQKQFEDNDFPTLDNCMTNPNKNNVNQKILTDNNEKSVQCKVCSNKFNDLTKCLAHELTHIIGDNKKVQIKSKSNRKKKKNKNVQLSKETPADTNLRHEVTSKLYECPNRIVLETFRKIFQPLPVYLNTCYKKIYEDLNFELQKIGIWDIMPFGSTVTGMALKTSDMDFFIHFRGSYDKNASNLKTKKLFYQLKSVLFQSKKFLNVYAVPRARVPVLKCKHYLTDYNLDINLTSRIGVFNSQFIQKVIQYDNRIHPLLLIIKVWAKSWEITNTGRITNYCITILVIFYLQNCEPKILPSIKQFQENCEEYLVDGYNFGFAPQINFNKSLNNQNILELLKGFFKFYTNFDYNNLIISTYLGISISKNNFKNNKCLFPKYHEQLEKLKKENEEKSESSKDDSDNNIRRYGLNLDSPVIIQDPFCLTMNKFNTGPHIFRHFLNRLEIANKICLESNILLGKLIIKLLYETPETEKQLISSKSTNCDESYEYDISKTANSDKSSKPINSNQLSNNSNNNNSNSNNCIRNKKSNNNSNDKVQIIPVNKKSCILRPLECELTFIRCYLPKKKQNKTYIIEIKKIWCEKMIIYSIEILKKIYKINVDEKFNEILKKSPKNDHQTDVHSNDNFEKIYTINANLDLWNNRKIINMKQGYSKHLEKNLELTNIKENERKLNGHYQAHLNCELIFKLSKDYSSIDMELINLDEKFGKHSFETFFNEFSIKSRNLIIAYFQKNSKDINNDKNVILNSDKNTATERT